jgi:hypothetical protein
MESLSGPAQVGALHGDPDFSIWDEYIEFSGA